MKTEIRYHRDTAALSLDGRLDGHTATELEGILSQLQHEEAVRNIVLDVSRLNYLSSAGIRTILAALKSRRRDGGELVLAGLHGYPEQVLRMAGFADQLRNFSDSNEALSALGHSMLEKTPRWNPPQPGPASKGQYHRADGNPGSAKIRVLGHIEDVLWSRVSKEKIHSKRFSQTEYSIGLGALGDKLEDYIDIMGEMVTIGGTMVWLPTDGHDTPDYLIPKQDTGEVMIRTGFNVSLEGPFQCYYDFTASPAAGATIADIYADLFAFAKEHRPDHPGAIATAMRAEMTTVHGSGVLFSPVLSKAPENGRMITDSSNFQTWFEVDETPRWQNVTGLLTGLGIDLSTDYSAYDKDLLGACFYINPANPARSSQMLHNHGVFFKQLPFPPTPESLEEEIQEVVERGDFIDMRHLLDGSRIQRALIGVAYIDGFIPDPEGTPLASSLGNLHSQS